MRSRLRGAVSGITGLLRSSRATAPERSVKQLTAEEVLAALPADAPAEVRKAIQSGC